MVIKETVVFWQQARIPVRDEKYCIAKLENMYHKWRALQNHSKRKSSTEKKNVSEFGDKLDDLFDILHANALDMITNEEDKQFLLMQREKGRPGCCLELIRSWLKKKRG